MGNQKKSGDRNQVSSTFKAGAIALVFLIIGYQVALFMFKASVTGIVAHRDKPDTVYVMNRSLAEEILSASMSEACQDSSTNTVPRSAAPVWSDDSTTVSVHRSSRHSQVAEAVAEKYSRKPVESFRFNPNTVSVEDLIRLGFSEKQAQSIENYRVKGGRFRRKSDFAKSFVVTDSVYKRLEPFIDIPLLDINAADSAAFDALPGIGPFFASKMVSYRAELRGYSYPEQLMDIWKFDKEKFDGLRDLITVGPSEPYPIWSLPEDSLRLHPYIRGAAHGIVLFRDNTPAGEWSIEALLAAGIHQSEYAAKLSRCRIAER